MLLADSPGIAARYACAITGSLTGGYANGRWAVEEGGEQEVGLGWGL